jgi:hypothetical protein
MRKFARLLSVLGLLAFFAPGLGADEAATPVIEFRLKRGDDPRWAARDFDDRDWEVVGRTDGRPRPALEIFPTRTGVYWVRYRVERSTQRSWGLNVPTYLWPADEPDAPVNSIFLPGALCYEMFWDGRRIGGSGVVGASREAEKPGPLDNLMLIPNDLLGPGPHVIAIRISNYHFNFPSERSRLGPILGNYAARLNYEARQPIVPLVGAAAGALVAIVCAVLYFFVDRRRPVILCGGLGLAVAAFFTLIAWRWLHNDPYHWLYPRYQLMLGVMIGMGVLVNWLIVDQFALPRRGWWLAGSLAVIVAVLLRTEFLQLRIIWVGRTMLAYALLPAAWAVWQRKPAAWLALAGVVVGLASFRQDEDIRAVLSPSFFLFFGLLVALLLGSLGWQLRLDRRRARETQLTAARMEIELLRKNLQPHFLLNTLTAVSETIEQDPAGAVAFIDDLAAVFRSLAQMSGERLVPLRRELELCRTHLRVVSRRTGRTVALEVRGGGDDELVPPALILTLIENGLLHQQAAPGTAFRLHAHLEHGASRFSFLSPGPTRELAPRAPGGTGLRYVKARLEESFPGRWTLTHGAVADGWETVIGWRRAAGEGGAA